jgi:diguanylate cyclase (GGDEF)-like protein
MSPSSRVTVAAASASAVCTVATLLIGLAGVLGVQEASSTTQALAHDELATTTLTGRLAHDIDVVHASGQSAVSAAGPAGRAAAADVLFDRRLPVVEQRLAAFRTLHRADPPSELADVRTLLRQWTRMRTVLNGVRPASGRPSSPDELDAAYLPLSRHVQALFEVEVADARAEQADSVVTSRTIQWTIGVGTTLLVLACIAFTLLLSRRLHKIMEPARDQVEFADTLQLAGDEDEAHHLLQRHLERVVSGGSATVLNRNNSADRLEAVTDLPDGSPLFAGLAHATPRSCLAVRSGRAHDEDARHPALMGCPVCAGCPGASTCAPLTVGGEVIGAVLVNRPSRLSATEQTQIRDAVGQAAPVLANMRNLAIAELRAATDSLTGLPNKRAVGDTLTRMLAQASRTISPLTLLVLDLDHFKDVNDRFGHPVGDLALANVGAALRSVLRGSDFAGRNGGEEFAVMLPNTDLEGALLTAEKIRAQIADIVIPGTDVRVTASMGVASYPFHATTPDRLERLADSALFVAKRAGRNRIEVASAIQEPAVEAAGDPVTGSRA